MFLWWLAGALSVVGGTVAVIAGGVAGGAFGLVVTLVAVVALLLTLYLLVYRMAWLALGVPSLPDPGDLIPPPGPGTLPDPATTNYLDEERERRPRAFMIGMNAAATSILASVQFGPVDPVVGNGIAIWVFAVVSLAAVPAVAATRVFQGVLGWTGWLSPMSLAASAIGFAFFVVNLPFAIASAAASGSGNWWPARVDWTSGVVETAGWGLARVFASAQAIGFTVGHFTFVLGGWGTDPASAQRTFTPVGPQPDPQSTPSAHEVGHSLDNVAFGGIRNLIALVDQQLLRNGLTAYTELTADSHVPHTGRYQVALWSGSGN